ncbi:hypothetical protein [Bacillus velezensis]|uniref:hypothetical protein n=1 Tax=Bacillus velezensis TaxID=492670 RepID=UPI0009B0E25E|nr:hypothetical protein [Bacillus velezensis]MEC1106992.1 hypothetical protein [Bacillus velezensis]OQC79269.1 hypothetical protein BKK82_10295 [Bacillus velezensis]
MLIKIDESVANYLIETNNLSREDSIIIALNNIAKSRQEGNHVIIGSVYTLEKIIESKLLDYSAIKTYQNILTKVSTLGAYEKEMCDYIVATVTEEFKKVSKNNGHIFKVPIEFFQSYYKLSKSVLICENPKDFYFYKSLAEKYLTTETNFNLELSFSMSNGGGSTSYQVVEHQLKEELIVLIIVDSDKRFKDDSFGSTQKEIQKIYNNYEKKSIVSLINLEVREKENLVSPSLYMLSENNSSKRMLELLCEIETNQRLVENLKFYDWKDGIKIKNIKNKQFYDYYKNFISFFEPYSELAATLHRFEDLKNLGGNDEDNIIPGLGSKLTDRFEQYVLKDGLEKKLDRIRMKSGMFPKVIKDFEERIQIKEQLFKNTPDYIKYEQIRICQKVIAWGCCEKIFAG